MNNRILFPFIVLCLIWGSTWSFIKISLLKNEIKFPLWRYCSICLKWGQSKLQILHTERPLLHIYKQQNWYDAVKCIYIYTLEQKILGAFPPFFRVIPLSLLQHYQQGSGIIIWKLWQLILWGRVCYCQVAWQIIMAHYMSNVWTSQDSEKFVWTDGSQAVTVAPSSCNKALIISPVRS